MKNICLAAIHHLPWLEYRHATPDGRVCIRVRASKGDFESVVLKHACSYTGADIFYRADAETMLPAYHDDMFDYFECTFTPDDARFKYIFVFERDGMTFKLDSAGLHAGADAPETAEDAFVFAYAYPTEPMPEWARGCVGYQIFPDRFRRSEDAADEEDIEPWSSENYANEYRFGGDLRGIREAVPYLKSLGVDVIYTNPIFVSDSSHRYNTFDYYRIDPLLGTERDLKELCDTLHENGMKLVLDGVFNHSGVGFEPFRDAAEKGKASEYYDWFFFDDSEIGYKTFSFAAYMPKLNLKNEACARYFLDVGRYWIDKCGIDGWRLDVSPEVWPDFWRRYHAMMKAANPDSIMIAECWDDSREWLNVGDMFDSTMNYVLSRAIWNRFADNTIDDTRFDELVNKSLILYPKRTQDVLWNFLGSHDTARFRTRAGGSVHMLKAAAFFMLTCPGVPIIYYGDELGMEGGEDPDCRRPMRWDDAAGNKTLEHFKRLTALRRSSKALRTGEFRSLEPNGDGLYAYLRIAEDERALVVVNTTRAEASGAVELPEALHGVESVTDSFSGRKLKACDGRLPISLAAGEGAVIFY